MNDSIKFVQLGKHRIPVNIIQSYRVVSKQQENCVTRYVNIDPDSPEGKKLLKEYRKKSTGKAVGAGIAAGTAGVVALGGATTIVLGSALFLAFTPVGLAITGATAVGSTIAGVMSSKNKSKEKEKGIYSKEVKDTNIVDKLVLEITLNTKKNVFKSRSIKYVSDDNSEILKKCAELDEIFNVNIS